MSNIEHEIQSSLYKLQDLKYREFGCRLIPTVDPKTVIGVRMPDLRKLAKEYSKTAKANEFLAILPHKYYEENNLHGLFIELIDDYDEVIRLLELFLPYIDNWATCDLISPNVFKMHQVELYPKILEFINYGKTYSVRFGIKILMSFYLDTEFKKEMLDIVANIHSDEYYINMMIAWYFATALVKQYDEALLILQAKRLDKWTHNKTIQKAIESYRISDEIKGYLRTLKIK